MLTDLIISVLEKKILQRKDIAIMLDTKAATLEECSRETTRQASSIAPCFQTGFQKVNKRFQSGLTTSNASSPPGISWLYVFSCLCIKYLSAYCPTCSVLCTNSPGFLREVHLAFNPPSSTRQSGTCVYMPTTQRHVTHSFSQFLKGDDSAVGVTSIV